MKQLVRAVAEFVTAALEKAKVYSGAAPNNEDRADRDSTDFSKKYND